MPPATRKSKAGVASGGMTAAAQRSRRHSGDSTLQLTGPHFKVSEPQVQEAISQIGTQSKKRGRPVETKKVQVQATQGKTRGRPRKVPKINDTKPPQKQEKVIEDRKDQDAVQEDKITKSSERVDLHRQDVPDEVDPERSYWLMKAEPESRIEKGVDVKFSIDDLAAKKTPEPWDGVRNPVARNNLRAMIKGDLAFFYHSNCKVPGVAGIMEIVEEHSVDQSAFDPKHPYHDPKSKVESPKWFVVHVEFRHKFENFVSLSELKKHHGPGQPLADLATLKSSRISVSRVTKPEWDFVCGLAGEDPVSIISQLNMLSSPPVDNADDEDSQGAAPHENKLCQRGGSDVLRD